MAAAHIKRGVATPLLFDRLLASADDAPARRLYDAAELQASVAEQLGWLLNTRVPVDFETLDARTRAGLRSTIDYGIPDLSAYSLGDDRATVRLCSHLAQTIAIFEPRLRDPQVRIAAADGRHERLTATVTGNLDTGEKPMPVSFELGLDSSNGG